MLRAIGIALNAAGAFLLAWRVKSILEMLVTAQHANDVNFRLLISLLNGQQQHSPLVVGMNEQVERAQKRGIWLLVTGFAAMGLGNALIALSWILEPRSHP